MTYDNTPNNRNNPNNPNNMGAWAVGIVVAILLVGGAIYWSANSRHTAGNTAPTNAPTTGSATPTSPPATTGSGGSR